MQKSSYRSWKRWSTNWNEWITFFQSKAISHLRIFDLNNNEPIESNCEKMTKLTVLSGDRCMRSHCSLYKQYIYLLIYWIRCYGICSNFFSSNTKFKPHRFQSNIINSRFLKSSRNFKIQVLLAEFSCLRYFNKFCLKIISDYSNHCGIIT